MLFASPVQHWQLPERRNGSGVVAGSARVRRDGGRLAKLNFTREQRRAGQPPSQNALLLWSVDAPKPVRVAAAWRPIGGEDRRQR
jgi:hypothetical protein